MRMINSVYGHPRLDKIRNEVIYNKVAVALAKERIQATRLNQMSWTCEKSARCITKEKLKD